MDAALRRIPGATVDVESLCRCADQSLSITGGGSGTGALMVLTGFVADIAMLMRKKWGVVLAYVKIAATIGSIGVGLWQLSYMAENFPPGSPAFIGMLVGAGFGTVFRLGLLALYVAAVLKFRQWADATGGAT